MTIPGTLPEVGELSERSQELLKDMATVDPAAVAANLKRAESVAKAARPVLGKARATLDQASSSQAGFGGLGKARHCAAALRQAKAGPGGSVDKARLLIEELQTRLEQAERHEHLFTVRNQKSHQLNDEAKRLVNEAEVGFHTWQAVPGLLAKRLGDTKTAPIIEKLETLIPALDQAKAAMQTTAAALTKASQDAARQKTETCGQAQRAGSSPPPSSAQVQTWHQESTRKVQAIRSEVAAAHKTARAQAAELGRMIKQVTAAKDQLVAAKDGLIVWLKARAHIHEQMIRSRDQLEKAIAKGAESDKEREQILKLKKAALEELSEIQKNAAELATRMVDAAAKAELEAIRARAVELAARYQRARIVKEFQKPAYSPDAMARDIKTLSELVSRTEQEIGQAVRVIRQADASLGQAQAVRLAAARDSGVASGLLVEAERCAAVLAKGPTPSGSGGGDGEAKARQALTACDYTRASALINALPQGSARDGLLKQLADQQAHDNQARLLLAQAQALYNACQHDQALRTLATAQQKAKCSGDLRAIADLKAKVEAAKPVDAQVATLRSQAGGKFEACELQASMNLLLKAQGMARCKRHQEGIKREITLVSEAQAAEPRYQLLLGQAIAKYQDCRLTAALELLEQAKPFAKCSKYKSRIARMISKAANKKAYETTTVQMFQAAKKLYLDGQYAKARDMFIKAKEYTTCTRFKTDLESWIAKANSQIGSDPVPPDQPPPVDRPPPSPCAGLVQQLEAQARKVHETWAHWGSLKQAGQPLSVTGPAACRVAAAIQGFRTLIEKARSDRCQHTVNFARPSGAPNWPVGECGTWNRGQGQQTDPPIDGCDGWKRKVAEAERVYAASNQAYVNAHHERSRTGTPAAFAQLNRAICAKYAASVKLYQLVLAARRAGCQVRDQSSANFRRLVERERLCTGQSTTTDSQQPTSCADYVQQLRAQAEKVRQLVLQHNAAVAAGPYTRARGELGCKVKKASDLFNQLQDKAQRARCRGVHTIKNPAGGGGLYPYFRDCTRWSQGQGQ